MNFDNYYFSEAEVKTDHSMTETVEELFVRVINDRQLRGFARYEKTVRAIVDAVGLEGTAKHLGRKKGFPLNEQYLEYRKLLNINNSPNTKPKTDFKVNDRRISLKMGKGWLFAHRMNDASVFLLYSLDKNPIFKQRLYEEVNSIFEEIRNIKLPKQPKAAYLQEVVPDKKMFVDKFKSIFYESENDLRISLIKIALSGEFKFDTNSDAVADDLMVVRFKNKNDVVSSVLKNPERIKLNECKIYDIQNDNDYISKIANKAKVHFQVERVGAIRLDINSTDLGSSIINEYQEFLTENIFDEIAQLLQKGWEFAKDKVTKFFKFLIDLINKGIVYFLNFLGVSLSVSMENEIEF